MSGIAKVHNSNRERVKYYVSERRVDLEFELFEAH